MQYMTLQAVKKRIKERAKVENMPVDFHIKTIKINGEIRGCSGFVQNTENGSIVYICTECMPFTGQAYKILYRTAKHLKDWTGGHNNYATPEQLAECVMVMLKQPPQTA